MQRGTDITVFHEGFRISEDSLASIGVVTGSTCWGVRVPDRNTLENPYQFAHFLISPFEPSSWPILLRVEMCIDSDPPDALARALKPLVTAEFSILYIEVTPAGHRHSIATIIGEVLDLKQEIRAVFRDIPDADRTYRNKNTWDLVHTKLAPLMLKRSAQVVSVIKERDKHDKFLRAIFLDPGDERFEHGVTCSVADLHPSVRALGVEQRTPAVRCTWMQNHAFFWLYSRTEYFEFQYDGAQRLLKIVERWRKLFTDGVSGFILPFKAIGLIDSEERFVRAILSPDDLRNRTVQVTIPFEASYDYLQGSKGFQHQLYSELARSGLKLRHVSMSTRHRDLASEKGRLSLLVAKTPKLLEMTPRDLGQSVEQLQASVQTIADGAAKSLLDQTCRMECENVVVRGFSAPLLFLSTKINWISNFGNLKDRIKEMAIGVGFNLVMVDANNLGELQKLVPEIRDGSSLTTIATEVIQHSAAFMQIIPADFLRTQEEEAWTDWLLFEFGAAAALKLPYAILVDVKAGTRTIEDWQKRLRVGKDYLLRAFTSDQGSEPVHAAVRNALEDLAKRTEENRR
jgi:hypothetical protein